MARWMMGLFLVLLVGAGLVRAENSAGVDLAKMDGWDIVLGDEAIPSEVYAAEEFQNFFEKASGLKLPIVSQVEDQASDHHIYIGPDAAVTANMPFNSKLGKEAFEIYIARNKIVIYGGRPRGTLYGVYTFLEDYLGVRFLTVDHTHVPKVGSWRVVGPVYRSYETPLEFRWSFYLETNSQPAFAARMRTNTVTKDEKLGGVSDLVLINHTLYSLIPIDKYGKDHPEYFAQHDGKFYASESQHHQYTQPCLTNPEVYKIVLKAVLDDLDAHPEKKMVSISQNDNQRYCKCEKCAALDAREGSSMGSLLTFVNAIADEVAKTHPDVKVGTLAYQYTRKPPKTVKPRDNVVIQLCTIECCMFHPLDDPDCPDNKPFCDDLLAWGKICDKISIWNYDTNFSYYLLPCPNLNVIGDNVRYLVSNNAKGIFMQANYQSLGGEFSDLRNYIMSRILWNPKLDDLTLRDEFIRLHYGNAAGEIREFLDLTHASVVEKKLHKNCFGYAKDFGIDDKIIAKGYELFDRAMAKAENETIRSRVEKASICVHAAAVDPVVQVIRRKNIQVMSKEDAAKYKPLLKRVFDLCKKHNITRWRERWSIEEAKKRFETALGSKLDD